MSTLTIVVGMAGSGKSTFCKSVAHQTGAKLFEDATLTSNDERRAGLNCLGEIVARLVGRNEDCIIDESHLTVPSFRNLFKDFCDSFLPNVNQKWIFFEKDVRACINNVYEDAQNGRDDPSRFKALNNQRVAYQIPEPHAFPGFQVQPVTSTNDRFGTETEAIVWLESKVKPA